MLRGSESGENLVSNERDKLNELAGMIVGPVLCTPLSLLRLPQNTRPNKQSQKE